MNTKIKDPKKVESGRKGGKLSGANFKRNKKGASIAAQRRQWLKAEGQLADYPLGLLDQMGREIPSPEENAEKRKR